MRSHHGILKPGFFCGSGGGASAAAPPKKAIGIRETWRVSPVASTGLAKAPVSKKLKNQAEGQLWCLTYGKHGK